MSEDIADQFHATDQVLADKCRITKGTVPGLLVPGGGRPRPETNAATNAAKAAVSARSNRAPARRGLLRPRLPESKTKAMKYVCIKTPASMGGWELTPTLPPLDVKVNAQIQRSTTELNASNGESRKMLAGDLLRCFSCNLVRSVDGAQSGFYARPGTCRSGGSMKEASARILRTQARRLPALRLGGKRRARIQCSVALTRTSADPPGFGNS